MDVDTRQIPERLGVLAEPNRFRIVGLLRDGPHAVNQIVDALSLGQPQVSRHLRILHEAGLVGVRPEAQRRIYSLERQPFEDLNDWFGSIAEIWSDRLDSLDEVVHDIENDTDEERS